MLLPITNYNILGLSPLIVLPFIKKITWSFLLWFLFFLILIIINLNSFEAGNLKYFSPLLLFLFFRNNVQLLSFIRISSILMIAGLFIEFLFTDSFRSLFRASNQEWHYMRFSSFFLYPGDLGSFGAILASLELMLLTKKTSIRLNNFKFIFVGLILIFCSQSRMAIVQLLISFGFFLIIKPKWAVIMILPAFIFINQYFNKLNYLSRENFFELLYEFNPFSNNLNVNKRAEEFINLILINSDGAEFYEGSIPSFFSRFGIYGLVIAFILILILFLKNSQLFKIKNLIVFLPLALTSFIGAPFERPKLLLFSICALLYVNSNKKDEQQKTF